MPTNIKELEALRRKLDRDRRELEERESALAKVEQMLLEAQLATSSEELPITTQLPKISGFTESVRLAVQFLGNSQKVFTVPDIEDYLLQHGVELPADPRTRIAMVLKEMRVAHAIVMAEQGAGRQPNRYTLGRTGFDG